MSLIRWLLGRLVLFFNWLTQPAVMNHPPARQAELDAFAAELTLYEFNACPFCVKVRRELRRLGIDIERRDARRDEGHREELLAGGGRYQVPCLRIPAEDGSAQWLYESGEIIDWLRQRTAQA